MGEPSWSRYGPNAEIGVRRLFWELISGLGVDHDPQEDSAAAVWPPCPRTASRPAAKAAAPSRFRRRPNVERRGLKAYSLGLTPQTTSEPCVPARPTPPCRRRPSERVALRVPPSPGTGQHAAAARLRALRECRIVAGSVRISSGAAAGSLRAMCCAGRAFRLTAAVPRDDGGRCTCTSRQLRATRAAERVTVYVLPPLAAAVPFGFVLMT